MNSGESASQGTSDRSLFVVMARGAAEREISEVLALAHRRGLDGERSRLSAAVLLSITGPQASLDASVFACQPGVERVFSRGSAFPCVARSEAQRESWTLGPCRFDEGTVHVIAGPCAVRSTEQMDRTAARLAAMGIRILRAGAFKPRTSPYSFQGAGDAGLRILRDTADRHGLMVLTEVMEPAKVEVVAAHTDMMQIGARNMYNYPLLREVGKTDKPVLLKRGLSATYEEWSGAAEYILREGNPHVVLCERGIRTFSGARATFDVAALPLLKSSTKLPVFADPSHAAGRRDLVTPLACAAIAAGADGLLVEVEEKPDEALSDGAQTLTFDQFEALLSVAGKVATAVGKSLALGAAHG